MNPDSCQTHSCTKCAAFGLGFSRSYRPEDFLEGQLNSRIWIIGLNPNNHPDYQDPRTDSELRNYFSDPRKTHPYFKNFAKVSSRLYSSMGKENGVAHTDIVKCYAQTWPPKGAKGRRETMAIFANCLPYLRDQINKLKPDIIICNGSPVCARLKVLIPPLEDKGTHYFGEIGGKRVAVVLSGFIRRIDDYAKRRLGQEIEELMDQFGIG